MKWTISKQLTAGFASISLILVSAVSFTIYEVRQIDEISTRVVELRAPTARDSSDLLSHINGSLASLRGYMLTGSSKFKTNRADHWTQIKRIKKEMDTFSLKWTNPRNVQLWDEFKVILDEFELYQDKVENVSNTEDERPATKILLKEAVPLADILIDEITKIIDLEIDLPADQTRKRMLGMMADIRGTTARALANIRAFLLTGDTSFQQKFEVIWEKNTRRFEDLRNLESLLSPEQLASFEKYTKARQTFLPLQDKMFKIRNSAQWHVANHILITEAAPRAEKLLSLLVGDNDTSENHVEGIAESQQQLLLEDSDHSHQLINTLLTTEWILMAIGLLLAGMIGVVTVRSVRQKEKALDDTNMQLAATVKDLEVSSSKLNESNRLMEDAIESVGVGLIIYDKNDKFVICNSTHRDFYPEISDRLIPNVSRKDIVRDYVKGVSGYYDGAEYTHNGDNPTLEIRPELTRQLPDDRWIQVTEQKTREGGIVAVRTDITHLKEQEENLNLLLKNAEISKNELEKQAGALAESAEKLEHSRSAAEAANAAKSNFLSTMSHEIRTPLNGVLGIAQLLKDTTLDDDQVSKVNTILSSGHTLLAIINDVLDMSKIEAGGLELEEKSFSLPVLVSTITTPFQSLADDKGIDLIVNYDIDSGAVIKGDPVRLRQILWNLLSNAIKFTEQGQVLLSFEIRSDQKTVDTEIHSPKDHLLYFAVEDTGAGIDPDRIDAIFEAFTQADNTITRKHGGTGLGLSIVKKLTSLMGGTIKAESEIGKGTKFIAYIPFDAASDEEMEAVSLRASHVEDQKTEPLNIIIAEDNEVNAVIAKAFLDKFGHSVKHVENGKLAVEAAKEEWADVILMDIHMPEMNGIDATKAIRASDVGKNIPIIGLTAEAFVDRHAQFIEAGMVDVLTKPFTEQQLADVLASNRLIDRRGMSRDAASDADNPLVIEAAAVDNKASAETDVTDNDATPIGNENGLAGFRKQLPEEVLSKLLSEAQNSLNKHLTVLQQAVQENDSKMIRETAHAIKGASGSMFAVRVSELASELEGKSGDKGAVHDLMPEFEIAAIAAIGWWNDKSKEGTANS